MLRPSREEALVFGCGFVHALPRGPYGRRRVCETRKITENTLRRGLAPEELH